jgi:hypothetical protein
MPAFNILIQHSITNPGQMPVTGSYDPRYLEGGDQEDHSLRVTWANRLQDYNSKITRAPTNWTCGLSSKVPVL